MSLLFAVALSLCAQAPETASVDAGPIESPIESKKEDEPARPELVLWHAYRSTEAAALEQIVVAINAKETRFSVRVLAVPYDAYLDKITAAIPRGRGPDVFIAAHDTIGDWAEAKTIDVVDDVLDPAFSQSLLPSLVDAVLYKGHAYGVPLAFKSLALFRNTALVTEAPATLPDFERVAKEQTKDGRYGLVYENRLFYFHAPFLFGFGGRIFDDAGKPALASPENIESVRYAMKLQRELQVVPQETNGALVTALFNEGKAAFMIGGPWTLGELDPSIAFAVSPLPTTAQGVALRPFVSVEAAFISGRSAQRALAVELVRALAGEEASRTRLVVGLQPVARKSAWDALDTHAKPPLSSLPAFKAQLSSTLATPNTPAMKSVWSQVDTALGASLGQGLDPAQTLAEANVKLTELVKGIETGPARGSTESFALFVLGALVLLGGAIVVGVVRYGPRKLVADAASNKIAYVYLLPAALGTGLLVFVPFFFGIGMGFFEHTWGKWTFVGLASFERILGDSSTGFFRTLGMTVLWTTTNVLLHVAIGVFLALLLSQAKLQFRGLYRALFILPWAVPSYITALIWKGMFHPELGAINALLGTPGFSWMNETWSAFTANLVTNVWLGFPFMMVTALGGLTAIPKDLYEAAALDGAGPLTRFTKITMPLLVPTLAPAIVLGTVWTFNMFNVIYLVSGGAPQGKTDILITEAFRWAFERGQGGAFGMAAAYSTMVFVLLAAYTTAASRVAKKVAELA